MGSETQAKHPSSGEGGAFPQTRWSLVVAARQSDGEPAQRALAELCEIYWHPIYVYARRRGQSPADAEDLTQEFFARLLSKDYLASADGNKGKLRTFLLVAMQRFMAEQWKRSSALKRGGGAVCLSIDTERAEHALEAELASDLSPEVLFDRQWAMTLLESVIEELRGDYVQSDRTEVFDQLRHLLLTNEATRPYRELGEGIGLSEGAVKVAVYRMRQRYRQLLHERIADTVSSPDEVAEEIRHLFGLFGPH